MARYWTSIVPMVVLKGKAAQRDYWLMAFRNHEAARREDDGAELSTIPGAAAPYRVAKVGIRSIGGGT